MKIYIVQFGSWDYESSYTENIKAFFHRKDAEVFKTKLELICLEVKERIKKLNEERKKDRERIDSLNISTEERMKLRVESGGNFNIAEQKIINQYDNDEMPLALYDREGYTIETLECSEYLSSEDFTIK